MSTLDFMTDTQNPISMTTHNSTDSIHHIASLTSSNVKKTHRTNFARSEPERSVPKTIKNIDHLSNLPTEESEVGTTSFAPGSCSAPAHGEESGRERLKRHRVEVAGRVWIPDVWGQEDLLKDWIDCTVFDASLGNNTIMSARAALVGEGRSANSGTLRIENRC